MNSFYNIDELKELGLKSYGRNVLLSKKCSIYGAENIEIGNNVRIDDFCILSGKIKFGDFIHVSAYSALYAGDIGITLHDFSGVSGRCLLYAVSDDFSGFGLTNSTVPAEYKKMIAGPITLNKHCLIGAGSIVLPNVEIGEGTNIAAMSFVKQSTLPWKIYGGVPAKPIKDRSKNLLEFEKQLISDLIQGEN